VFEVQAILPPEQQSAGTEHPVACVGKQHLLDVHEISALVEQQSPFPLHSPVPVGRQHLFEVQVVFPAVQQSPTKLQLVEPRGMHAAVHTPPVQVSPGVQQSLAEEQPPLPVAKQQLPEVQVMLEFVEQHSSFALHPPLPVAKQHLLEVHVIFAFVEQQWDDDEQLVVPVIRQHLLELQVVFPAVQQSPTKLQLVEPRGMHAAVHTPPVQVSPGVQQSLAEEQPPLLVGMQHLLELQVVFPAVQQSPTRLQLVEPRGMHACVEFMLVGTKNARFLLPLCTMS